MYKISYTTMGLRDKVALVVIAVELLIVCIVCVPQSVKNDPFEKFTHKQKYVKSNLRSVDKENYKRQRYQDDSEIQSVYKTFHFPEVDYPSDTTLKIPSYIIRNKLNTKFERSGEVSSVDVLSDSVIQDNLRKEKRKKRRNEEIYKIHDNEESLPKSLPESYKNLDVSSYFTQGGMFPEVQYPLNNDKWSASFTNPSSFNKDNFHLPNVDFSSQKKKEKKKMMDTFLTTSVLKENLGVYDWATELKEELRNKESTIKNVTDVKNNKQLKKNLISSLVGKEGRNKKITENSPNLNQNNENQSRNLIDSANLTKKKILAIQKIVDESRKAASKKTQSSPNKVILEAKAKRFKPRQFSKLTQSSTESKTCPMPCNITHVNNTDLAFNHDSDPNITNVLTMSANKENFCELAKLISEIQDMQFNNTQKIYTGNDFTLLSATCSTNDSNSNRDLNLEITYEDSVINEYNSHVNDNTNQVLVVPLLSKNTVSNSSNETKSVSETYLTGKISDNFSDSLKNEPLLYEMTMDPLIESYPVTLIKFQVNALQSDELLDYPVTFEDDYVVKSIADDNSSSVRLQENIITILNENLLHDSIYESHSTSNSSVEQMIEQKISQDKNVSQNIPDLTLTNISYNINNNSIDKIIEVQETDSVLENDGQPKPSNELAGNLRGIISTTSSANAFIDDLHEIIRLLRLWKSRINDSKEVIHSTGEKNTENSLISHSEANSNVTDTSYHDLYPTSAWKNQTTETIKIHTSSVKTEIMPESTKAELPDMDTEAMLKPSRGKLTDVHFEIMPKSTVVELPLLYTENINEFSDLYSVISEPFVTEPSEMNGINTESSKIKSSDVNTDAYAKVMSVVTNVNNNYTKNMNDSTEDQSPDVYSNIVLETTESPEKNTELNEESPVPDTTDEFAEVINKPSETESPDITLEVIPELSRAKSPNMYSENMTESSDFDLPNLYTIAMSGFAELSDGNTEVIPNVIPNSSIANIGEQFIKVMNEPVVAQDVYIQVTPDILETKAPDLYSKVLHEGKSFNTSTEVISESSIAHSPNAVLKDFDSSEAEPLDLAKDVDSKVKSEFSVAGTADTNLYTKFISKNDQITTYTVKVAEPTDYIAEDSAKIVLADEERFAEDASDNSTLSTFFSNFTLSDIITSLAKENEFLSPFISTYANLASSQTLNSTLSTNFIPEGDLETQENSVEAVCQIFDQFSKFDGPENINSTQTCSEDFLLNTNRNSSESASNKWMNCNSAVTSTNNLITNIESEYLNETVYTNITLSDLLTGNISRVLYNPNKILPLFNMTLKYHELPNLLCSDSSTIQKVLAETTITIGSDDKKLNISDFKTIKLSDNEMPDFSDYTSLEGDSSVCNGTFSKDDILSTLDFSDYYSSQDDNFNDFDNTLTNLHKNTTFLEPNKTSQFSQLIIVDKFPVLNLDEFDFGTRNNQNIIERDGSSTITNEESKKKTVLDSKAPIITVMVDVDESTPSR